MLTEKKILDIVDENLLVSDLSDSDLLEFCILANDTYRSGSPIVSDENYDFIFIPELQKRLPHNPFLQKVESESEGFSDEKIKLPEKMLSTDKAYTWGEIEKWLERISKFSEEINVQPSEIQIKGTAKLDGFAGYDDGKKLYTRGDGNKGSDISRVFQRGLGILNDSERGQGPGEIVVKIFPKYARPRGNDAASAMLMKRLRTIITDKKLTMHSLRHRMKDKLRNTGCPEAISMAILGHGSNTVAANYGSGYALDVMREQMEKVWS